MYFFQFWRLLVWHAPSTNPITLASNVWALKKYATRIRDISQGHDRFLPHQSKKKFSLFHQFLISFFIIEKKEMFLRLWYNLFYDFLNHQTSTNVQKALICVLRTVIIPREVIPAAVTLDTDSPRTSTLAKVGEWFIIKLIQIHATKHI